MFDKSQLLKGTLEGCILKTVSKEPVYAYGAIEYLRNKGFTDLTEGTIYPLLLRLERQGLIGSEYRDSAVGPKRKYYLITDLGRQYLNEFEREYCSLEKIVKSIMEE
ncbi:MAG: PadR family transcriptional regulator [Clostridia bacterium]|nr:PadR family transcriptional regulator [Clostridia bacterium]